MEAHRWFKNGDHPEDDCNTFQGGDGLIEEGEGKVVRCFKHPEIPGDVLCQHCGFFMHMHGWIDKDAGGQKVCPGDIVVKIKTGEYEVFRKDREYDNERNKSAEERKEASCPKTGNPDSE